MAGFWQSLGLKKHLGFSKKWLEEEPEKQEKEYGQGATRAKDGVSLQPKNSGGQRLYEFEKKPTCRIS